MEADVAVLITTTKKKRENFERLLDTLETGVLLPANIVILCDAEIVFNRIKENRTIINISVYINKDKLSLTLMQNQIIQDMKEEYVLLLNDDIILDRYYLSELIRILQEDKDTGIVCGKILRIDKQKIDSAGQCLGRNRTPVDRGYGLPDKGQFDIPEYVFGACGAAVLYRRKMLEEIAITAGEYFDSDYHMFYEDLDIAWRAGNFGWKIFYNPKAIAYHHRGATAKIKKPKLKLLELYNFAWLDTRLKNDLLKNRYMTIIKNDCLKNFLLSLPFILLYDLKIWIYCLFFDKGVFKCFFENRSIIMRAWEKRKVLAGKINKSKGR
ncbi:MAG: hypothetical protein GY853_03995 [PVC group bacterium]|nr:hypothetical protein [PVC group bacterium]